MRGAPCFTTWPLLGSSRPAMIRIWVDLPAPFTPTSPILSPAFTSQVTSRKTSPVG